MYPPAEASSWRTSKNWLLSNRRAIFARSCGEVLSQPCTIALSLKIHTSLALCDSFFLHGNKLKTLHETPKSTQFSFWITFSRLGITITKHVQSTFRTTILFPSYIHAKNYTKKPSPTVLRSHPTQYITCSPNANLTALRSGSGRRITSLSGVVPAIIGSSRSVTNARMSAKRSGAKYASCAVEKGKRFIVQSKSLNNNN